MKPVILHGRQQSQWNSADEAACAEFSSGASKSQPLKGIQQVLDIPQNPVPSGGCQTFGPVLRSRWPLTHEYSPEERNLIWLPAAHSDEKLDTQHKTTSQ